MPIHPENANLLKAISHSIRIKIILERTKRGPCNIDQIAKFFRKPSVKYISPSTKIKSLKNTNF